MHAKGSSTSKTIGYANIILGSCTSTYFVFTENDAYLDNRRDLFIAITHAW